MALSEKINSFGAGDLPAGELPVRPTTSSTPADNEANKEAKLELMNRLAALHKKNEQLTGFCTHPGAVVFLTVLKENEGKLYRAQYKIAGALKGVIDKIVERWKATGKIKKAPRDCPFNSPLLAVPKKDDSGKMVGVRLCIDIRTLNQYLEENDRFQIPRISDILSAFAGNKLFGEYDLSEAYNQFQLSAESQKYTAFTYENQQYVFVGCPFGIKHIGSLFQRFITDLFKDMPFVFPYIDNIGFASKDWEQHYQHARMIVERLNSVNLRIKPSSYNLGNTQITLLGHLISEKGISLDPEKKEMIARWERPETGERMQSVLGLGAYLRDHVRHYADITAPLEAVKRNKVIVWTDNLVRHWDLFKKAFATAPLLVFPDFAKRFVLATDASQTGIGGILYQPDDDDNTITAHNIVALCSKQLNGTQRNYPTYKKELWALIYCLRKFHSFLWGRRNVTVLTDHKPLVHILSQRVMTVALQQWVDVLMDYDLMIKYRPGILHVIPDALSRMYEATYCDPSITWGTQSNITFIDKFRAPIANSSDFLCVQSLDAIKPLSAVRKRHREPDTQGSGGGKTAKKNRFAAQVAAIEQDDEQDDAHASPFVAFMSSNVVEHMTADDLYEFEVAQYAGPLFAASDLFTEYMVRLCAPSSTLDMDDLVAWMENGSEDSVDVPAPRISLLTAEQQLLIAQEQRGKVVPDVPKQKDLLAAAHALGHFGENAIYASVVRQGYWWPYMRKDIARIIDDCNDCQRYTVVQHGYHPAQSISALRPGDHYQMDLAQFSRAADGSNYCLVVVDVCSGFIMLRPLKQKTAQAVAESLWHIFTTIGVPKILQSDNGSEFVNDVIKALTRKLGVNQRFISEYNPRADGKVERAIRTVKSTVMKLLHGATVYWPLHLPFVQYAYNNKVQTLTGSTPFSLMFGRTANAPNDYRTDPATNLPINVAEWRKHQEHVLSLIFPAINARVAGQQAAYRDRLDDKRKRIVTEELVPGTRVRIKDPKYLSAPRPSQEPPYIGPYYVVRQNKYGAYILKDVHDHVLDRSVPIDQIKVNAAPDILPTVTEDAARSQPAAGDQEYDVEKILEHRHNNGQIEYLVKWKGYRLSESTWENEHQFTDTAIIDRYWRQHAAQKIQNKAVAVKYLLAGTFSLTSCRPS